jgi:ankyrin repeat protein
VWTDQYDAEASGYCPYCRQFISNFTEKERLFFNIKKLKMDNPKNSELMKFLTGIMHFKKSNAYTCIDSRRFSTILIFNPDIPSYDTEMLESLKKIGWDINSSTEGGLELLKKICQRDDLYRLNLLLDFGLRLDQGSEFEKVATEISIRNQSNLVLERIVIEKSISLTRKLQDLSLNIDDGDSLVEACQKSNFEKVKLYVEKGVDVNFRDARGARPLHKACSSANIKIIEYLIENGAEINCTDLSGKSPLHEACTSRYERKDVVQKLLELNANVSFLDQDKNTQLHVAIISRKYDVAELLLDHYENVKLLNVFNESPLHLASDFAPKSLVEKLIEKGSEIDAKDFKERSPLHRAVASNIIDVVDLLLSKGANVNQVNKNKDTAVLLAIKRKGALPFVASLVKHGADLNIKDSNGKAALENYMAVHK